MTEHYAQICPTRSRVGTTLCIRGGSLHGGDTVLMTCPGDPDTTAVVRRLAPDRLELEVGDRLFVCRPWQAGDPPVERLPGASSSWFVAEVADARPVEPAS